MRMPARNQRQVDTGYVDEQGHRDTEDAYPKPPIAVRTFPVGAMNMRFMMVTVLDLIHAFPAFLGSFVSRTTTHWRSVDQPGYPQNHNDYRAGRSASTYHVSLQSKYVTEPATTAVQVCSLATNRS